MFLYKIIGQSMNLSEIRLHHTMKQTFHIIELWMGKGSIENIPKLEACKCDTSFSFLFSDLICIRLMLQECFL